MKSWPSSTVTVLPPGAVVGECACTSESQVFAPKIDETSMIPLVSQMPGPTGTPSRPGGAAAADGWVERGAARGARAAPAARRDGAFDEVEPPDRSVATLLAHDD